MIVYRSTKTGFLDDFMGGGIEDVIHLAFQKKLNRRTSPNELESWRNSLSYIAHIMHGPTIPEDAGIAIETQIPQTSKRIDFIISGFSQDEKPNVVIVELKQWSKAERTEKDGIVVTALGGGLRETSHPSYQAWSYAAILEDFSATVEEEKISLMPCAYLHNYAEDEVIRHPFYQEHWEKAPVFLKSDALKLQEFISRHVARGDRGELMYRIDQGKIRPSKQLADALVNMIKGNREFHLIDEQKLVFESALHLTKKAKEGKKQVMIVEGGPGTGKSVVAINLLVEITKRGMLTQYVTKNAAPRAVYERKLTGAITKSRYGSLFRGSGSYVDTEKDQFDALVVDEAHRLNEGSGLYGNLGENQVKEIINAASCSIFFIDEDQRVTMKDIGTKDEIKHWARQTGAEISEYELPSQFRCNGSDGYLAFIDNALQIRETANVDLADIDYDFRVVDNPNELMQLIEEKNAIDNRSRVVAGYCWDWKSKRESKAMDIVIPEYGFEKQWNLSVDGSLWILKPESIEQIGCIHTCQGLELNYVGVIIGDDLIVRDGNVVTDPYMRSKMDQSVKGFKKMMKEDPDRAKERTELIIKNTYRTLMTRGMKGCYIYCIDEETREYFKGFLHSE